LTKMSGAIAGKARNERQVGLSLLKENPSLCE